MNTTGYVAGFSWPRMGMRIFAPLLALFFVAMPLLADQNAPPPAQAAYAQQTPGTIAAIGSAHRAIPGLSGGTGSGGFYLSRASSSGRQMGASTS